MKGGLRENFYREIGRGFQRDDFTQSFLYRYLRAEKEREAREEAWSEELPRRADPYALLEGCFHALERGEIGEAECLRRILRVLLKYKSQKLRIRAEDVRESLGRCGRQLCGTGFDGFRQDRERYEALLRALEQGAGAAGRLLSPREWGSLREELLKRALETEARAFLYDGGLPGVRGGPAPAGPRKKDRLLDMLDAYLREEPEALRHLFGGSLEEVSGGVPGAGGGPDRRGSLSREQRARIEACYQAMKWSKQYLRVFLPIRIDPESGTGLFIVGRNHFSLSGRSGLKRELRGSCCYACFYPNDVRVEEEPEGDGAQDPDLPPGCFALLCYPETERGDSLAALCNFPNLEEALSWYEDLRANEGLSWYQEVNGPAPPGCPEELRPFFSGGGRRRTVDQIELSEEELRRSREEAGGPERGGSMWTKRRIR